MEKKGVIQTTLVVLVIFVVSMMLIFGVLAPKIFLVADRAATLGVCGVDTITTDFADTLTDQVGGLFANTNIYLESCPITVIPQIKKKDYPTEKEINELFAKEAARCYYQYQDLDVFPSGEKIPTTSTNRNKGRWERAQDWMLNKFDTYAPVTRTAAITVDGNNIKARSATAPPVYCAICAKVSFDQTEFSHYAQKEFLPQYTNTLKTTNEELLTKPFNNTYEFLDQGRHKGVTKVDTLERYSYDPTKTNVVVYYRRYSYEYSVSSLQEALRFFKLETAESTNSLLATLDDDLGLKQPIKATNNISRAAKQAAIPQIANAYNADRFGTSIGSFAILTVQNKLGLYKWFSPYEENMVDEYGVATIPYEYVAHQCDFVANGYGV